MGKVYLVGAGPGADDLITLRGACVLGMADVVLHDALIEPAMLDLARPQAIRIAVGKRHGQAGVDQGDINEMIVDAGRRYPVVVRLKGGDPMLYARADEEMRVLEAAGLPFEIVPGITTALAGAAAIRRSLTLRGVARSVCFSTASHASGSAPGIPSLDADSHVVYMGRERAPDIARQFLQAGRAPDTPVVVVESCSTRRQRILQSTLHEISMGAASSWFAPSQPSLLMIGEAFGER